MLFDTLVFQEYWGVIDSISHKEVLEFVKQFDLGEEFTEYPDVLFVGRINGKISILTAYRLSGCDNGQILPRFIHVVIHPDLRRSKEAIRFLRRGERALVEKGYTQTTSYILNNRKEMIELSKKFGYQRYHETQEGVFMYKNIGARK